MKKIKEILGENSVDFSLDTVGGINLGPIDIDLLTDKQEDKKYNIQEETKQEVGEALSKIRANEKKFRERLKLETETGFYFSVVFKSEKEMKEFLEKKRIRLEYNDFVFFEDISSKFK